MTAAERAEAAIRAACRWTGSGFDPLSPEHAVAALMADPDLLRQMADEADPPSEWVTSSEPHMDGSHTVSVPKYPDRPGQVTLTVPAGYGLHRLGWMREVQP